MFYLWHESYDKVHPKVYVVKFQEKLGMQQYDRYEKLGAIIENSLELEKYNHYFLLDDSRFDFFSFDIYREVETPLTQDDLNNIVSERLEYLKTLTKEELLFPCIDNIYVNGEEKKYLIGEKGEIFFRMYFIYINRNTLLEFNNHYGDVFNQENVRIYPESFKTITFLKKNLERDSFLLLYIKDSMCKVVAVEDGFYKQIDHINFGVNNLMQMYKDNQIVKYWYKSVEEIESNPLAKNLVLESLRFYVTTLCKWLEDLKLTDKDIFLVSSIIKNGNFMEEFNKVYAGFHNRYIVPFHHSEQLNLFGKHWDIEEMDTLIFLNEKKVRREILGETKEYLDIMEEAGE